MRILLAGYQSLFLNRGGPTYKIMMLKQSLSDIGVDVDYYDYWDSEMKLTENTLVHLFTANMSTYPFASNLRIHGARYVVNPIFFSNHSAGKIRNYLRIEKFLKPLMRRSYSDYYFTGEVCRGAEKILPNTEAEGKLLSDIYDFDSSAMQVIHNGVESRFTESDPDLFISKYGLKDFILNVGHLGSPRKNGVNMLKALAAIDVPSVVIADILNTEEGRKCREIIEGSNNITYIPWVRHDDPLLSSAYAACKVFVLPTRYETPGRAALEAALAGANIVITPYGGTREYFKDLATYCEPNYVESIITAIETSLITPKNSELSVHIREHYVWEKISQQTMEMYKELF